MDWAIPIYQKKKMILTWTPCMLIIRMLCTGAIANVYTCTGYQWEEKKKKKKDIATGDGFGPFRQ
jgi:hypothetical protein